MTPPQALARQRAAALAVWRVDADARPDGEWAELGGLQVHTTGLAPRFWNGALLHAAAGGARLADAAAWFAARGRPFGLLVPAELGVSPAGFTHVDDQRTMLRALADLPPVPPLRLADPPGLDDVVALHVLAFGDPPEASREFTRHRLTSEHVCTVVATVHGRAAATATGVLADGVVGVFGVATHPSMRRRGLGTAVTLAVLHRARQRGADLAYLNTSEEGFGAYRALGFAEVAPWHVWVPSDPAGGH